MLHLQIPTGSLARELFLFGEILSERATRVVRQVCILTERFELAFHLRRNLRLYRVANLA